METPSTGHPGNFRMLKVAGERNSGTNYVTQLIHQNYSVELRNGAFSPTLKRIGLNAELLQDIYHSIRTFFYGDFWKHSFLDDILVRKVVQRNIKVVIVIKNPYSYLNSLYNKPYHLALSRKLSFLSFLKTPLRFPRREKVNNGYSPIELWNLKHKKYIHLSERLPENFIIIRYEDLLLKKDILVQLKRLEARFGLVRKNENLISTVNVQKRDNLFSNSVDAYINEDWKAQFTQEHFDLINNFLDNEVIKKLGYEKY